MPDVRLSQLPAARPLADGDVLWAEQARDDDGVHTRKVTVGAITQRAATEAIEGIGISAIAAALGLPIADFGNPNNSFLLAI